MSFPDIPPDLGYGALLGFVVLSFLRVMLWMIGLLPTRREDRALAAELGRDMHDIKTSLTQIVDSHHDLHARLEAIRLDLSRRSGGDK